VENEAPLPIACLEDAMEIFVFIAVVVAVILVVGPFVFAKPKQVFHNSRAVFRVRCVQLHPGRCVRSRGLRE
jgi:hypothetical protein